MSIFDSLGGGDNAKPSTQPPQQAKMNPQQAMQKLRADPSGVLKQAGYNVPGNMRDPHQIINHLLQSGQLPRNRLTMAMQMMGSMGLR